MKKSLFAWSSVGLILAGCAGTDPAPRPAAWTLEGSRIIGCCCATPCSCRLNKKPMQAHGCDYTTAVHVDRGRIGDVRMDGMTWVFVARGFAQDTSTNWTHVYVTDKATDAQMKALQGFLEGGVKGLNPKKVPHLVGKFLGLRKVPMTYTVSTDRREYAVSIPGILDFRTKAIVLPGHADPVRSTGIFDSFGDSFVHAETTAHTLNDPAIGYRWDLTGRQANQADFSLDADRVGRGGIGWGCWSAHDEFGPGDKYQEEQLDADGKHQSK